MTNPSVPPPASFPVQPPLIFMPIGTLDRTTGNVTAGIQFLKQWQQMWAAIQGSGGLAGLVADVATLQTQVLTIFGMHGDGTLSAAGVLTVTETNGVAFGFFATGTDASHLTGTLNAARIANGSLPYATLANAISAELLGASAAGPIGAITVGAGLVLATGSLASNFTGPPAVNVSALPAATATQRAFVNDSNVTAAGNFGAIVAGGGGNFCPVYADGTNWRIG